MAANSTDDIFKSIILNENDRTPIQISLKFVHRTPADNTPALVQVMARRQTGQNPLPEPMMTQVIGAYMRHGCVCVWGGGGGGGVNMTNC